MTGDKIRAGILRKQGVLTRISHPIFPQIKDDRRFPSEKSVVARNLWETHCRVLLLGCEICRLKVVQERSVDVLHGAAAFPNCHSERSSAVGEGGAERSEEPLTSVGGGGAEPWCEWACSAPPPPAIVRGSSLRRAPTSTTPPAAALLRSE